MRVIALLALFFGAMSQGYLDGQTFTHGVFGVVCGIAAVVGGLGSAREDYADAGRRWLGWIMAGLGLALAIFCVVQLPSAYKFQAKFNERSRQAREMEKTRPKPTTTPMLSTEAQILAAAEPEMKAKFPEGFEENRPYHAEPRRGIWWVHGMLPTNAAGGTAEAAVEDGGKVTKVWHTQ
jgi:hypothetical protein